MNTSSARTVKSSHTGTITTVLSALAVVGVVAVSTTVPGAQQSASTSALGSGQSSTASVAELGPNPYDIGVAEPTTPSQDQSQDQAESQTQQPSQGQATDPFADFPRSRQGAAVTADPGVRIASAPGVVLIDANSELGEGAGTGMVLTADGQVLTNYHVVEGSEELTVTVADTGRTYQATVVGRDRTEDVALLQLKDASGLQPVSVSEAAAQLGESVYAIGNGNGQGYLTRLTGKLTGINEAIDVSDVSFSATDRLSGLLETDADVVPGYSGGPLVDEKGRVIGINTAASTGPEIDGYARPIGEALTVVAQIRAGKEDENVRIGPKGALGVQVATDPRAQGAMVAALTEGSAAAKAGVTEGSVITGIDGQAITSGSDLATRVGNMDPGTSVELEWQTAEGATESGTVTLGESPVN